MTTRQLTLPFYFDFAISARVAQAFRTITLLFLPGNSHFGTGARKIYCEPLFDATGEPSLITCELALLSP